VVEAVSVGDLVTLMRFSQGDANLVELTLGADAPVVGTQVKAIDWPDDTALVTIIREGRVLVPSGSDILEGGDELLFVATAEKESELEALLAPHQS
jgi:trk system potassium uptake protein TrkA